MDNCCYSRPYDLPGNMRIILEAKAVMTIQRMIEDKKIELVSSSVVLYENSFKKNEEQRECIVDFIMSNVDYYVDDFHVPDVERLHKSIMEKGIGEMDAYHLACAIKMECDYLITTDDRVLKFKNDSINPYLTVMA